MTVSNAKRKANAKWDALNKKSVTIGFYKSDSELLDHLNNQSNKAGYIKGLIREDMKNSHQISKNIKKYH